ncbi:MAG TPA: hypothetical protein PKA82_03695 [Pyrinomonadaceae bacterium]|nr:hypothetical protein [Pyrinomonadaceae bacterium]
MSCRESLICITGRPFRGFAALFAEKLCFSANKWAKPKNKWECVE